MTRNNIENESTKNHISKEGNYLLPIINNKKCTICLLHDTPLPPSQALFKAFHLVNKEWPLTNSGALLQRLKLIGSSQNLLELIYSNINSELNIENQNPDISLTFNQTINNNSKNSTFQFVFKEIPSNQIPFSLPFSVIAYIDEGNNGINNNNRNNNIQNIRIIGHSRWTLAKPVFSTKKLNIRQVIMDSLVVDEEFRKYGIGKSILLYGEEILKKMNAQQIFLQTKHAKNFYLKYGYIESKNIPMIKIEKKIYENISLDVQEVDNIIQTELSYNNTLKPRDRKSVV